MIFPPTRNPVEAENLCSQVRLISLGTHRRECRRPNGCNQGEEPR